MTEDQMEELAQAGRLERAVLFKATSGWGCWAYGQGQEHGEGSIVRTPRGQARLWPRLPAVLRFLEAIGAVGRCSIAIEIDPSPPWTDSQLKAVDEADEAEETEF